jgi:hypothetical protein
MAASRHFAAIAKTLDHNYPERVHKVFIVRAPAVFASIWRMVSPLVDAGTKAKISIYVSTTKFVIVMVWRLAVTNALTSQAGGTSADDLPWQDEMRAFIEDDQIPCYLGGSCNCLDRNDGCPSLIPRGNALPETPVLISRSRLCCAADSSLLRLAHSDSMLPPHLAYLKCTLGSRFAGSCVGAVGT